MVQNGGQEGLGSCIKVKTGEIKRVLHAIGAIGTLLLEHKMDGIYPLISSCESLVVTVVSFTWLVPSLFPSYPHLQFKDWE